MKKQDIVDLVMNNALTPPPVYRHTHEMTERVLKNGVPGDFVECGVYRGAQVAIMALAKMGLDPDGPPRKFHLFDSFEGIPEAGPEDDQQPGIGPKAPDAAGRLVSSGHSVCSLEGVQRLMDRWGVPEEILQYHKGWFQHTVPLWDGDPIALLRLDGDLYSSTLVCLEHLYPFVSSGGIVIIDDYNLAGCRKAVAEYFGEVLLNTVDGGNGAVWFEKK